MKKCHSPAGERTVISCDCQEVRWSVYGHAGSKIEKWLDKHSGAIVFFTGPGAGGKNKALIKYYVNGKGEVWVMKIEDLCAIQALINAVAILIGYKAARILHVEWGKINSRIRSLADLTHLIQGVKSGQPSESVSNIPKIQFQRVSKSDINKCDEDRFEWLANQKGVWIFALQDDRKVDHVVVVDGLNRLI